MVVTKRDILAARRLHFRDPIELATERAFRGRRPDLVWHARTMLLPERQAAVMTVDSPADLGSGVLYSVLLPEEAFEAVAVWRARGVFRPVDYKVDVDFSTIEDGAGSVVPGVN